MTNLPACRAAGVDMFPDREDAAGNATAVAVCLSCPLRSDCARDALDRGERFGVWGALTEAGRDSMRRHGRAPTIGLTARRVAARRDEVARLAAQGVTPSVIAVRLGCNTNTVSGDLKALRSGQSPQDRAAVKAAAAADLNERIDVMLHAGASIDTVCRELHVGGSRVVGRRRAIGVAA